METNGSGKSGEADPQAADRDQGEPKASRSKRRQVEQRSYEPDYDQPRRQPSSDRENAFNSLAWMLEGATGLMEELRHSDLGLSEEFWVHALAARREGLLALRAILVRRPVRSTVVLDARVETRRYAYGLAGVAVVYR